MGYYSEFFEIVDKKPFAFSTTKIDREPWISAGNIPAANPIGSLFLARKVSLQSIPCLVSEADPYAAPE
jgi:hypothetical protein